MIRQIRSFSKQIDKSDIYSFALFILITTLPILYLAYFDGNKKLFTYTVISFTFLVLILLRIYLSYNKEKVKQNISMIVHDIKAPLARVMFKMQSTSDYIVDYYKDIKEIECMLNDIILAISDDKMSTYEEKKKIDFYSMVESIVEDYIDMGKNINLNSQEYLSKNIMVYPIFMKRAIINIIENSLKYASKVSLKIKSDKNKIMLDIIDNGPGTDNKNLAKLTTAFYQNKDSKPGKGLGLYITNKIIKEHNGSLTLSNNESGGFKASIELPIS